MAYAYIELNNKFEDRRDTSGGVYGQPFPRYYINRLNAFKSAITKVADNLIVLADLNLKEFDFLSEQDKKRLEELQKQALKASTAPEQKT